MIKLLFKFQVNYDLGTRNITFIIDIEFKRTTDVFEFPPHIWEYLSMMGMTVSNTDISDSYHRT